MGSTGHPMTMPSPARPMITADTLVHRPSNSLTQCFSKVVMANPAVPVPARFSGFKGLHGNPSNASQAVYKIPSATEGGGVVAGFLRFMQHFIGGQIGGCVGIALAYPLDTIKVRVQAGTAGTANVFTVGRNIWVKEGFGTFYKGIAAPFVAYGVIKATTFGVYGNCLDIFRNRSEDPKNFKASYWQICVSGFAAGAASTIVMGPSDRVKVAMQVQGPKPYNGTLSCAMYIAKTEGLFTPNGLFKGTFATLWRDMPSMGVYYLIYEVGKKIVPPLGDDGRHTPLQMMVLGGLGGAGSWLPGYPFDVLKTRLQDPSQNYKGLMDCFLKTVGKEGPLVLYKGLPIELMKAMPLHGSVFMCYEVWMKMTGGASDH